MLDGLRRMALAVAAFFLPMEYLPLGALGDLPITPSKLAGILLVIVAGAQWMVGPRDFPRSPKHLWMLAFGFSFAVANVVAILSGLPFMGVLPYLVTDVALLLFYFVVLILVRSRRDLDWTLASLVLGAAFIGASALLGYGVVLQEGNASAERLGGLGGNPNEAAGYLAAGLPLAVAYFITRRRVWKRAYYAGVLVLLVVAGFATLSRALFLTLPLMWLFGAFRLGRVDLVRYGGIGLVLAAILVVAAPASVRDRVTTLEARHALEDGSVMSRVYINNIGLYAFVTHPIEGVGRRNFMNWSVRAGMPAMNVIHNMFLDVAAEQGLIGLIPFLAIVWIAWSEFSRSYRATSRGGRDPELKELRLRIIMMQTGYLGMLILGLFHPTLEFKGFWLYLGLSTSVRGIVDRRLRELRTTTVPIPDAVAGTGTPWGGAYESPFSPGALR